MLAPTLRTALAPAPALRAWITHDAFVRDLDGAYQATTHVHAPSTAFTPAVRANNDALLVTPRTTDARAHDRSRCTMGARLASVAQLAQQAPARELLIQRATRDAEPDRGARDVLALGLVDPLDVAALERRERVILGAR